MPELSPLPDMPTLQVVGMDGKPILNSVFASPEQQIRDLVQQASMVLGRR